MNIKELANIARIIDGIDLERCVVQGRLYYSALFDQLGIYRIKELQKGFKRPLFYTRRKFAKYLLSLINEFGYELSTIPQTKGKPAKYKSSVYEIIISYLNSLKQLGYDPEKYCVKDAATIVICANRNALQGNIENIRQQLKTNNRAIFDVEFDDIDPENYEDEVKEMLERYAEVIKDQK